MDTCQRQGSKNRILSIEQIQQTHDYVLRLLEEVGSKVECEEALDILGHSGCDISDTNRVKIPRNMVIEAIEAAPSEIEVYDRNGNPGMVLKKKRLLLWNRFRLQ